MPSAAAGAGGDGDAADDPFQEFLRSVGGSADCVAAKDANDSTGAAVGSLYPSPVGGGGEQQGGFGDGVGAQPSGDPQAGAADGMHELPPGIFQPRLPHGWREYQDTATGHPYYVDEGTGRSTWARPHMIS